MPQGRQENENTCNRRGMPQQNQVNEGTNRIRGRGIGMPQENHENGGTSGGQASRPLKRQKMVGFGILVGDDGFTTVNVIVGLLTLVPRRSDEVTRDIGYQPRFGVKCKGKSVITSNRLQQMRGEKRIQTRPSAAAINASQSNSTTKKTNVP
ncbi:hypothetical protein R3W88_000758 [Solanum pinnatisectum]|uniref:Uncharacterized protein n=1 Tax=Solanum pinnatisectum TaxID=50273 RepID=A0AAV9MGK8_9SOLN|nr:hypothetical protein R3W88_000758 [Solanum pinnatisectum]